MEIHELVIDSDLFVKISSDDAHFKYVRDLIYAKTQKSEFDAEDLEECFYFYEVLNSIASGKCVLAYNDEIKMEFSSILMNCPREIKEKFGIIIGCTTYSKKITKCLEPEKRDRFKGTSLEPKIPYLNVAYCLSPSKIITSTKKEVDIITDEHLDKLNEIEVTYKDIRFVKDEISNHSCNQFNGVNDVMTIFGRFDELLSCILYEISKIKLTSGNIVIPDLEAIKIELEKLKKTESLNAICIEELNSTITDKLNNSNSEVLKFLEEISDYMSNFPKNDEVNAIRGQLDKWKQPKVDKLQIPSEFTTLIGFIITIIQFFQSYKLS